MQKGTDTAFPSLNLTDEQIRRLEDSEKASGLNVRALTDAGIHELATRATYFNCMLGDEECSRDDIYRLTETHTKPDSLPMTVAVAARNTYKTFTNICRVIREFGPVDVNAAYVRSLHQSLSENLLKREYGGAINDKGAYMLGMTSPYEKDRREEYLQELFIKTDELENPTLRALFVHLNLIRLQPFLDCNKRTARMAETTILLSAGLQPVITDKKAIAEMYSGTISDFLDNQDYKGYARFITALRG